MIHEAGDEQVASRTKEPAVTWYRLAQFGTTVAERARTSLLVGEVSPVAHFHSSASSSLRTTQPSRRPIRPTRRHRPA